jgi:dihydroorotate dehydrogenase
MPDWSYRTVLRPVLFRLGPERGRGLTLNAISRLAALPGGVAVIRLMGHMAPPATIGLGAFRQTIRSPIGLAAGIDVDAIATRAFSEFGFGFIEVGPVAEGGAIGGSVEFDVREEAIRYALPFAAIDPAILRTRLEAHPARGPALLVRLSHRATAPDDAAAERVRAIALLAPFASAFVLETAGDVLAWTWTSSEWEAHLVRVSSADSGAAALLVALPAKTDADVVAGLAIRALALGIDGVVVTAGARTGTGLVVGRADREAVLASIQRLRARLDPDVTLIAAGGMHEPDDALALRAAGATCVAMDSGFVFGGPGLPKRANEAIAERAALPPGPPIPRRGWIAAALLGIGMIVAGSAAWAVAALRVVLPYEEAFAGLDRAGMAAVNARLLGFMAHDRVTLGGGMLSIGVLYIAIALFGLRQGASWARHALIASGGIGFASFLLLLGYRFFDPMHFLVTLILLPFFILAIRSPLPRAVPPHANLWSDARWRRGLWGQLAFVALGAGLIGGGAVICVLGASVVFVPSDLAFMHAAPRTFVDTATGDRLLSLIAHDRAGLGGLLVSEGVAVLLLSLWAFREGARWLWWTLLIAGLTGFVAAIGVHLSVGYLDAEHLAPAAIALALYGLGLGLSFSYLWASEGRRHDAPSGDPG